MAKPFCGICRGGGKTICCRSRLDADPARGQRDGPGPARRPQPSTARTGRGRGQRLHPGAGSDPRHASIQRRTERRPPPSRPQAAGPSPGPRRPGHHRTPLPGDPSAAALQRAALATPSRGRGRAGQAAPRRRGQRATAHTTHLRAQTLGPAQSKKKGRRSAPGPHRPAHSRAQTRPRSAIDTARFPATTMWSPMPHAEAPHGSHRSLQRCDHGAGGAPTISPR